MPVMLTFRRLVMKPSSVSTAPGRARPALSRTLRNESSITIGHHQRQCQLQQEAGCVS